MFIPVVEVLRGEVELGQPSGEFDVLVGIAGNLVDSRKPGCAAGKVKPWRL